MELKSDIVSNAFKRYNDLKFARKQLFLVQNPNPEAAPKESHNYNFEFTKRVISDEIIAIIINAYYNDEHGYNGSIRRNPLVVNALNEVLNRNKESILEEMDEVLKSWLNDAGAEYKSALTSMVTDIDKELSSDE